MGNHKTAEVSNTHTMPANESTNPKLLRQIKQTAMKTAEDLLLEEAFGVKTAADVPPEVGDSVPGTQPVSHPQAAQLNPHVDVTGKSAPSKAQVKKAERYALPSLEHYPLDSYQHVKEAANYFDQWGSQLAPEYRREYCYNLVKRAGELGIEVSNRIRNYGAESYAPAQHIKLAVNSRRAAVVDETQLAVLDKIAEMQPLVAPDMFCGLLSEFDKQAELVHLYDHDVIDPYYSVYGEKLAEDELGKSPNSALVIGNDYISIDDLKQFALIKQTTMKQVFGEEVAEEFRKDPVGIFNSLPSDQKKMIIRMATDNAPRDKVSG